MRLMFSSPRCILICLSLVTCLADISPSIALRGHGTTASQGIHGDVATASDPSGRSVEADSSATTPSRRLQPPTAAPATTPSPAEDAAEKLDGIGKFLWEIFELLKPELAGAVLASLTAFRVMHQSMLASFKSLPGVSALSIIVCVGMLCYKLRENTYLLDQVKINKLGFWTVMGAYIASANLMLLPTILLYPGKFPKKDPKKEKEEGTKKKKKKKDEKTPWWGSCHDTADQIWGDYITMDPWSQCVWSWCFVLLLAVQTWGTFAVHTILKQQVEEKATARILQIQERSLGQEVDSAQAGEITEIFLYALLCWCSISVLYEWTFHGRSFAEDFPAQLLCNLFLRDKDLVMETSGDMLDSVSKALGVVANSELKKKLFNTIKPSKAAVKAKRKEVQKDPKKKEKADPKADTKGVISQALSAKNQWDAQAGMITKLVKKTFTDWYFWEPCSIPIGTYLLYPLHWVVYFCLCIAAWALTLWLLFVRVLPPLFASDHKFTLVCVMTLWIGLILGLSYYTFGRKQYHGWNVWKKSLLKDLKKLEDKANNPVSYRVIADLGDLNHKVLKLKKKLVRKKENDEFIAEDDGIKVFEEVQEMLERIKEAEEQASFMLMLDEIYSDSDSDEDSDSSESSESSDCDEEQSMSSEEESPFLATGK